MTGNDDSLGLKRDIPRRDILQGFGVLGAGSLLPRNVFAQSAKSEYYPPARTGMRGSHPGSFEAAHERIQNRARYYQVDEKSNYYDLVVVGAGISGLSAAFFYRQRHRDAKILILDNHDDFGGHAKRNEFLVNGQRLIGYGGSQTMVEPSSYSRTVKRLLRALDIDPSIFETAYDQDFYKRHDLGAGIHFDKANFGVDRVVRYDLGMFDGYYPLAPSDLSPEEMVAQLPISSTAQQQLLKVMVTTEDRLPDYKGWRKDEYLYYISYRKFLEKHLGVTDPDVFKVLQDLSYDSGVGIEAVNAWSAMNSGGLPGRDATGLDPYVDPEPYIHHFPDGNATIARALVHKLIPETLGSQSINAGVTSQLDYSKLDLPGSDVRIRLNSTVLQVENDSDNKHVTLAYHRDGTHYGIRAGHCVMAGYNAMLPYIVKGLPGIQAAALSEQVKVPILYSNVALRNWQAWHKMRLGAAVSPTGYHVVSALDFPVSIGDYRHSQQPDEPIIVQMQRFPHASNSGLTAKEQFRVGRQELIGTSFETIETNIREQLGSMLSEGGFDPARDIEGITVNRWAHGYSSWYNPLFEANYDEDDDPRYAHVQARKRHGRITIAGSDSAAVALMDAAIEQAYRAVRELPR